LRKRCWKDVWMWRPLDALTIGCRGRSSTAHELWYFWSIQWHQPFEEQGKDLDKSGASEMSLLLQRSKW
jgi:hypothetical protein